MKLVKTTKKEAILRHSYFRARQVSCVATKILDLNVLELSSTALHSQNILGGAA